jgi:hypothetical protein
MNKTLTPKRSHTQQSPNVKSSSLSKLASCFLLLLALLVTSSKNASAGSVMFNSDNGAFAVIVTTTATTLNKTPNGTSNFNYTINISYNVTFTGTVPANFAFYNFSGAINNNDGSTGFQLSNPSGAGTITTYTQTHADFNDFATATPASVGATAVTITVVGPDLSQTSKVANLSAAPLPVQVKAFTAKPSNEGVAIAWETVQETQVQSFTIERSTNGKQWTSVATVAAKGANASGASYAITDNVVLEGNSYYRLSELGVNGATIYYNTLVVSRNAQVSATPQLFPNPNSGNTVYFTGLEGNGQWQLSVTGAGAQNVNLLAVANGQITLPELPAGLYFLSLRNATTGAATTIRYSKL